MRSNQVQPAPVRQPSKGLSAGYTTSISAAKMSAAKKASEDAAVAVGENQKQGGSNSTVIASHQPTAAETQTTSKDIKTNSNDHSTASSADHTKISPSNGSAAVGVGEKQKSSFPVIPQQSAPSPTADSSVDTKMTTTNTFAANSAILNNSTNNNNYPSNDAAILAQVITQVAPPTPANNTTTGIPLKHSDSNSSLKKDDKFAKYKKRLEKRRQSDMSFRESNENLGASPSNGSAAGPVDSLRRRSSIKQSAITEEEDESTAVNNVAPKVSPLTQPTPAPSAPIPTTTSQQSTTHSPYSATVTSPQKPQGDSFLDWVKRMFCCVSAASSQTQLKQVSGASPPQILQSNYDTQSTTPAPQSSLQQQQQHQTQQKAVIQPKSVISQQPAAGTARPLQKYLLRPLAPEDMGKKCLVLDLDETLIHSSFKPISYPDYIIPVEIDGVTHNVYVLKRPYVDEFLRRLGPQFEIVIFTASLSKYADPVIDNLDKHRVVKHRLFREACFNHRGSYVKDLSQLGRDLRGVIILDNAPASYLFHPSNAIPVTTWFNGPNDTELLDLIPFLEDLRNVPDVRGVLDTEIDDDN